MTRGLRRVLLALHLALAVLAAVEAALRLQVRLTESADIFVPDPVVGWRLRPGMRERPNRMTSPITSNAEGLRNPEVPRQKTRFRILCLGDSVTFGLARGVDDEDAWPRRLEEALGARGVQAEVINAGMVAYRSLQMALLFEELADRYRPDLVIVTLLNNEKGGPSYREWSRRRLPIPWWRRLVYRSELGRWMLRRMWRVQQMDHAPVPRAPAPRPDRSPEVLADNLALTADRVRATGADRVILVEPLEDPDSPEAVGPSLDPEERVAHIEAMREAARKRGVPFVAVAEQPGYDPESFFAEGDTIHPGVAGCRFMGETVADFLVRQELVPR